MMTTYWIIGKTTSNNDGESKLNPMQRFKQDHPNSSPSAGYPGTISEDLSPSVQLYTRDTNTLSVYPPSLKVVNHSTTPRPEWPLAPSSRRSSLGVASSGEWRPSSRRSSAVVANAWELRPGMPMFDGRPVSHQPLPLPEGAHSSHLAVYTALAEENAKQARRLADLLSASLSNVTTGSIDSSIPPEGTSVDPHLRQQCPMQGTSRPISAPGHTSQQRMMDIHGTSQPKSPEECTSNFISREHSGSNIAAYKRTTADGSGSSSNRGLGQNICRFM